MTGAVVSTTVTVWLHWGLLVQASVAWQVRVASKVLPQWPAVLVTVLRMVIFFNDTVSAEIDALSLHDALQISVLLVLLLQFMTGAVVSTTVTVWLHWALLVQASVACQVGTASKWFPHWPAVLVTAPARVIVAVRLLSVAVGRSKVQALPSCTVL